MRAIYTIQECRKDVLLSYNNHNSPVNKILRLLACADQLNDGVKHLRTVRLLLLLKNEHEVMAEARLHHDPVDCTSQVNVSRQENDVFACVHVRQCMRLDSADKQVKAQAFSDYRYPLG